MLDIRTFLAGKEVLIMAEDGVRIEVRGDQIRIKSDAKSGKTAAEVSRPAKVFPFPSKDTVRDSPSGK